VITIMRDEPPLPMDREAAVAKAVDLAGHIPWRSVSYVMGTYHGVWLSSEQWRRLARDAGLRPNYVGGRARQAARGARTFQAAA
jgi:hypothetical protein